MTFEMLHQNSPGPLVSTKNFRFVDTIHLKDEAPTLVIFAGVHGNEPAGVLAVEKVFTQLRKNEKTLLGNFIGIRGNLPGLQQGERFLEQDLNRLWTSINIKSIQLKKEQLRSVEEKELLILYREITKMLSRYTGPIYFIDIHTTSSKTIPFITINDALINRKFSRRFPLPVILGIEEYLEGPLLSYINEQGYVSLGFECGQHQDAEAVDNAESFIWLALSIAGILPKSIWSNHTEHYKKLHLAANGNTKFYEVIKRFGLKSQDRFTMFEGFESFENIKKGTSLAEYNGQEVLASKNGILFMPLYQTQGEEGFFLIRIIPFWALRFSEFLRGVNWDHFLGLLPGVSINRKKQLIVNAKIARFLRRPLFHLLGYRAKPSKGSLTFMSNRERSSKKDLYKDCSWM
ncbi:MAG: succinylglutamate desuccinylase/aspartoacylase family protein [Flavobacteriaceae bacterium]